MKIFIARQPIFYADGSLMGYELLHRNSDENMFDSSLDGSQATRILISNIETEFGHEYLLGNKRGFINFTKDLLESGCPFLLDQERFIIEILENVVLDEKLNRYLDALIKKGYQLAVDDYVGKEMQDRLLPFCDIVKVDFMLTNEQEQREIAVRLSKTKTLLAEKVETETDFIRARKLGYSMFQGYYFSKPEQISRESVEIAAASYLRMWKEVSKRYTDFDEIEQIIRMDVNLAYKFLRKVNTLAYFHANRIESVRHAMIYLGATEIKRWILSLLIRDLVSKQNGEMVKRSLSRAVFAEKITEYCGFSSMEEEAYAVGLFSGIDNMYENSLSSLLDEMCIKKSVKSALMGEKGFLNEVLNFTVSYENGEWDDLQTFMEKYKIDPDRVVDIYLNAIEYAEKAFEITT